MRASHLCLRTHCAWRNDDIFSTLSFLLDVVFKGVLFVFVFWFLRFLSFINIKSHSVNSLPAYQTCNSLNVLGALHWTRAWKNEKNGQKLIQLQAGIGTKKEDPRRILKAKKKRTFERKNCSGVNAHQSAFFSFKDFLFDQGYIARIIVGFRSNGPFCIVQNI